MKYIHTRQLNLDVRQLYKDCLKFEQFILDQWDNNRTTVEFEDASKTTQLHAHYNLLHFPHPQLHALLYHIRMMFYEIKDPAFRDHYYISMWQNVHRQGQSLDWHSHSDTLNRSYHGFFTVFAEPSATEYKLPDGTFESVTARNNQLVISPSAGDEHRTTAWTLEQPRITVAFDIVPLQLAQTSFNTQNRIHNWVPI